jgi:predicted ATPase/class 3 adenylate cyclase/uncharacterized protein HemY
MHSAPSGTVTFLFTDMEGSTKRWEAHPQQMQLALRRHDTILQEAIGEQGGYVFKTMGDGFCAAFPTAQHALDAAVSAQKRLHSEEWAPEIGSVRVRMALHTGSVDLQGGDYFGQPLNRVARILSAGHGGQTLLSEVTYGLVRDTLPAGVAAADMGEHRLKDLYRPEHVFQLLVEDLSSEFPPLKTLENRPNNLPVQLTPIVGREKETEAVCSLVRSKGAHLVTLTGPGGTGKTRLALQVAAEALDDFADGVWFVDLAPITDTGLVISTIARTLGVKETAGQPLLDTLKGYLKEKAMLLVLDNFEQVISAAPDIGALLSACPSLKVLVTSRVPLRIRGEKEHPVPPLSLPSASTWSQATPERLTQYEAVRLFIERATDVKPDFQVTNDNAPAVAEICVRLDGLPLAIELAAARIRLLTPQSMLSHLTRLSNRLKLLTGGARDAAARQQTLRSTIDWSYDLLDEAEKQLFRRLAVFSGGRSLEAIEQVCNVEGDLQVDMLDGVGSLIAKSLMRQEEGVGGEPRFLMLETIHEYAREKLEESGEANELKRRHAVYFLQFAERADPALRGPEQVIWYKRLEEEHDNLRSALRWSLEADALQIALRLGGALWLFWSTYLHVSEGRSWLETALTREGSASHILAPFRAKALRAAGNLALEQNEHEHAAMWHEESLALYRQLGDRAGVAAELNNLGLLAMHLQDYARAQPLLEQSLSAQREAGDRAGMATALLNLGHIYENQGDYNAARPLLEASLAIRKEMGDRAASTDQLNDLGDMARIQGRYSEARALFMESLAILREAGDMHGVGASLVYLGMVASDQGDYAEAQSFLQEAVELTRSRKDRTRLGWAAFNLGEVMRCQGDYDAARSLQEESIGIARETGHKVATSRVLIAFGHLARHEGDFAKARSFYQESLELSRPKRWTAIALMYAGQAEHQQGNNEQARALLQESLSYHKEMGARREIAFCLAGLAAVAGSTGQPSRAACLFGAAEALLKQVGARLDPPDQEEVAKAIAIMRAEMGDAAWGHRYLKGQAMSVDQAIEHALKEGPD